MKASKPLNDIERARAVGRYERTTDMLALLNGAFSWDDSLKGREYWESVREAMREQRAEFERQLQQVAES